MQTLIHTRENKNEDLPELVTRPYTIDPSRTKVNLSNFIYVPQSKVYITKIPYDMSRERLTWKESHYFLADLGLFMPDIGIFMNHYLNVRNTSQDRGDLYSADGSEISISSAFSIWQSLNATNKYGPVCSTWLDNEWSIKKATEYGKEDEITMTKDHRIKITREKVDLIGKRRIIEIPTRDYKSNVKLPLNPEGLPLEWVDSSNCASGLTVHFDMPESGKVTQYLSERIDCSIDRNRFSNQLFGCAYSTERLK